MNYHKKMGEDYKFSWRVMGSLPGRLVYVIEKLIELSMTLKKSECHKPDIPILKFNWKLLQASLGKCFLCIVLLS
jgi:hypothetical protein